MGENGVGLGRNGVGRGEQGWTGGEWNRTGGRMGSDWGENRVGLGGRMGSDGGSEVGVEGSEIRLVSNGVGLGAQTGV